MSTSNNLSDTKVNKYSDSCEINSQLVNLLKEFFSVNFFATNNQRKLTNTLFQQVNDDYSIILVSIECFQNNPDMMHLMENISDDEKVESIRIALENSFKKNLYGRILVFDHPNCIFKQGENFYEI